MATRSRRRSIAPSDESQPGLNTVEHLILAQSVWELGANSWPSVAKVLAKHPLISRPKSYFTAQSCHAIYDNMLHEAGLETCEDNNAVHAPNNLKLAQNYYQARVLELRQLILIEESSFKRTLAEIQEIQTGLWDDKIKAQTPGAPTPGGPDVDTAMKSPSGDDVAPLEEVFGSDLSGMTDTGSPVGQSPVELTPSNNPTTTNANPPDQDSEIIAQPENASIIPSSPPRAGVAATIPEGSASSSGGRTPVPQPGSAAELQPSAMEGPGNEGSGLGLHEPDENGEEPAVAENSDMKTDEQAPEPKIAGSTAIPDSFRLQTEVDEIAMDDGDISGEEPLQNTRRSTRRRMSSVSSALPRLPKTRKSRLSRESDPTRSTEIEPGSPKIDNEEQPGADGPKVEDDQDLLVSLRRREGKRKASFAEGIGSPRDKKRIRDDSEPVDDDDHGPGSNFSRKARRGDRTEEQVAFKRFQNVISMLHSQISQHRNGNIFHNPIKNSEAPDYHEIVKRPIDLKTIKAKVKDGVISNSLEFQRDIYLMFANALMYNRPGSDVHIMAEDMMLESEGHINTFRQTEGLVRSAHRI